MYVFSPSPPAKMSRHNGHRPPPREPGITRDNVRVSDIKRVDLVLHLNDQSSLVVRDVAFSPLGSKQ